MLITHHTCVILLWFQEGEFLRVEANSREDAQRLWQRERHQLQDTLRQQKEQMMEDKKWLEKEERLLVGSRASLTIVNPLSVSLCPPASKFNVALEATLNEASLNNINPLVHSRRPACLKFSVPLITVPKRGSTSIFYKMNLPVLLQDPMGPEEGVNPAVGVNMYNLWFQSQIKGRIHYKTCSPLSPDGFLIVTIGQVNVASMMSHNM